MPELPEVETVVRGLKKKLIGLKIKQIEVLDKKPINLSVEKYKSQVKGKEIKDISRRAKVVIIKLKDDNFLLVHLKMTGQLIFKGKHEIVAGGHPTNDMTQVPNKHTRLIFTFANGDKLFFNDLRKFGWVKFLNKKEFEKTMANFEFGPEPLDKGFTVNVLKDLIKKYPNKKLKQFLMDPKTVVGIGNIYSDEICFCIKRHPLTQVKKLSETEIKKLYICIKDILNLAVKYQGTTYDTFRDSEGNSGNFEKFLKVYGRAGEKCRVCKTVLKKDKIGGRSSVFCPKCQK